MLEYGFGNLGFERISANTLEHNWGAQRLLEKLGFVLEGVQRKCVYFAGRRWDKLNYGLLREGFYQGK
jgi:RimJ/RimL family protein N-acetyltransferase